MSDALDGKQSSDNLVDHGRDEIGNTDGGGEVGQQTESGTELDSNEVIETLCYKHVTLILIPKRDGVRDMLAMEIDLRFVKGHKRNFKRYKGCSCSGCQWVSRVCACLEYYIHLFST